MENLIIQVLRCAQCDCVVVFVNVVGEIEMPYVCNASDVHEMCVLRCPT